MTISIGNSMLRYAHISLMNESITYTNMINEINATPNFTVVVKLDNTVANPVHTALKGGTSGLPVGSIIQIPLSVLKTGGYYTDKDAGEINPLSVERVLAHEMTHAWQWATSQDMSDDEHEWDAAEKANQVMDEHSGEESRDTSMRDTEAWDSSQSPTRSTQTGTPLSRDPDGTQDYDPISPTNPPSVSIKGGYDPFGWKTKGDAGNKGTEAKDKIDQGKNEVSPLVLDLDNDGIELINLTSTDWVYWDVDEDGFAEATGWVSPDDGLLAIDLNEDGQIDHHAELFGSLTADGFSALAIYDSDGSGSIDQNDVVWEDLIVWRDASGDGRSQADEMFSLADFNIISIDLNASAVSQTIAGNDVTHSSTFTVDDGVSGPQTQTVVDAWFAYDNLNSYYHQDYTPDYDVFELPDFRGYGTLPDFRIAMSLDNDNQDPDSLISLVDSFASQTFAQIFAHDADPLGDVKDILFRWAGVENVATDSRGPFVDGRELEFLEEFVGDDILQSGSRANPFYNAGSDFSEAFYVILSHSYAQLMVQTEAVQILTGDVVYDIINDTIQGVTGLDTTVLAQLGTQAGLAADAEIYWQKVVRMIEYTYGVSNLSSGDYTALNTEIYNSDNTLSLSGIVGTLGFQQATGATYHGDSNNNIINGAIGDDYLYGYDGNDTLNGGIGGDTLYGGAGADTLNGEGGSDILYGGTGDDVYDFSQLEMYDIIIESSSGGGVDKIVLPSGVTLNDLTFTRISNGSDLIIDIDTTAGAGAIAINDQFNNGLNSVVDSIEFADFSTFDLDGQNWTLQGTGGNDYLTGVTTGGLDTDTIYGQAGMDKIYGGTGNDALYGGDDNDLVDGEAGDDTIDGGNGADEMRGGDGTDIFYTTAGDEVYSGAGNDTVHYTTGDLYISDGDITSHGGTSDEIFFAAGISSSDLAYSRQSDDLIIDVAGHGFITIYSQYYSPYAYETLKFADSTTVDLSTISLATTGTSSGELLEGAAYADHIYGLGGNDTLKGYAGADTLYGGDGNDKIYGGDDDDILHGGAGDDKFYDSHGNNVFHPGAGDDTVYTGAEDDTYYYVAGNDSYVEGTYGYGTGGTDVIEMVAGITFEDLEFGLDGNDLLITVGTVGTIELRYHYYSPSYAFETINFADSTSFDLADIEYIVTTGTAAGENIVGSSHVADHIYGLGGNDTLRGYDGDDILYGGDGDDNLYGYNDNDIMDGGDGADDLYGAAGNDTYILGAGDDYADDSGSGDDTYIYSGGMDEIYERSGGTDLLKITGGTTINDITVNDNGSHDQIVIDSGVNEIKLTWFNYSASYLLDNISFDDGFETTLENHTSWVNGTSSGETLNGTTGHDTIIGKDGDDTLNGNADADDLHGGLGADTLYGGTGNDLLHGGAGNDFLYGNNGDDILMGGAGADTLSGYGDADTFRFMAADTGSVDTITDFDTVEGDALDLADILSLYDPFADLITDFVQITDDGTDSTVAVDADGGADSFTNIAILENVTGLTDEAALVTSGNLIVV